MRWLSPLEGEQPWKLSELYVMRVIAVALVTPPNPRFGDLASGAMATPSCLGHTGFSAA